MLWLPQASPPCQCVPTPVGICLYLIEHRHHAAELVGRGFCSRPRGANRFNGQTHSSGTFRRHPNSLPPTPNRVRILFPPLPAPRLERELLEGRALLSVAPCSLARSSQVPLRYLAQGDQGAHIFRTSQGFSHHLGHSVKIRLNFLRSCLCFNRLNTKHSLIPHQQRRKLISRDVNEVLVVIIISLLTGL